MVSRKVPKFKHVLVIGNGFDLALALPTSYSDFINSDEFETVLSGGNTVLKHLKAKHNLQKWVDIEQELISHSAQNRARTDEFHLEYKELCAALMQYIKGLDYSKLDQDHPVAKYLITLVSEGNLCIVNFNYTETVDRIIGNTPKNVAHIRVHGSAEQGNIVFGVHDGAAINANHVFLRKAVSPSFYDTWRIGDLMKASTSSSIIGHSLGVTDHTQFSPFFRTPLKSDGTNISIFYHTEDSYFELFMQMEILTGRKLQQFKTIHNLIMIGPELS